MGIANIGPHFVSSSDFGAADDVVKHITSECENESVLCNNVEGCEDTDPDNIPICEECMQKCDTCKDACNGSGDDDDRYTAMWCRDQSKFCSNIIAELKKRPSLTDAP